MRILVNDSFIDTETVEVIEVEGRPAYPQPHNIKCDDPFADGNAALSTRLILKEHGRQKHDPKYMLRMRTKRIYERKDD